MRKTWLYAFAIAALFAGCFGIARLYAQFMPGPAAWAPSGVTPLAWNPAHYGGSACATLSGTPLTVATGVGSSADCLVYAINGQTTGKWFGEIDISGTVTSETAVGAGNTASPITGTYLGGDPTTFGLFNTGQVYNAGALATAGSGSTGFATASNMCVALDLTSTTKKIWWLNMTTSSPGAGWSGGTTDNPATGAGGTTLNAGSSTILTNPVVFGIDVLPGGIMTIVGNLPCNSDTLHGYASAYLVGFSPFPGLTTTITAETWNPNRIDPGAPNTFSSGNLTVTAGTGSAIRSTFGQPRFLSGKYYWQVTVTYASTPADAGGLGIANGAASAAGGSGMGFDSNSVGYFADGSVYLGSSSTPIATIASYASGTAVCVAADYSNAKVWYQPIGSGQWDNNGTDNPSSNTGGYGISAITQTGTIGISPGTTLFQSGDTAVAVFSGTPCSGVTGLSGFSTIP